MSESDVELCRELLLRELLLRRVISCSVHDDVGLDVEEQVVVAAADLQQQGRLFHQRLFKVGGRQEGPAVQLHDDVTISYASSEIRSKVRAQHFS